MFGNLIDKKIYMAYNDFIEDEISDINGITVAVQPTPLAKPQRHGNNFLMNNYVGADASVRPSKRICADDTIFARAAQSVAEAFSLRRMRVAEQLG